VFREPSTYEAMIRAELAAGNREDAEAVLRRMEERRYPVAVWMKARAIIDDAIVNPSVPPTPQAATTPSPESA
jgi:pentatricopeptide repeat protein